MEQSFLRFYAMMLLSVSALGAVEKFHINATDFVRSHVYTWHDNRYGDVAERIRKNGNIGGYDQQYIKGTRGFLEYDFNVSADGWYELAAEPENISIASHEFTLDGFYSFPTSKLMEAKNLGSRGWRNANSLGNLYLKKGIHTLRVETRGLYPEFSKITGFKGTPVAEDQQFRIRLLEPFVNEITVRKNDQIQFSAEYSNRSKEANLRIKISNPKNRDEMNAQNFKLPASIGYHKENIGLKIPKAGVFVIDFELDGKRLDRKSAQTYDLAVVDSTPVASTGKLPERTLLTEINCVEKKPDYAKGSNRIVKSNLGAFRETSRSSGWDRKPAEWFAYSVTVPEAQKLYCFEFDYPDDTMRATHFTLRSDHELAYPKTVGVNSGGEFRVSGKMNTATIYAWVLDRNLRLLVSPGGNNLPGAVAKMRVYRVNSDVLPPLKIAEEGKRRYQYFYEEAPSMINVMTGVDFKAADAATIMEAMHRYCSQTAFMGVTEHLYTHEIYGGGFWPSSYQPCRWTRPFCPDGVKKFLLIAERFGQNVMFDFHPAPMDFHPVEGPLFSPENKLLTNTGSSYFLNDNHFLINPIHPNTRTWRNAMLTDFVKRYKDHKNFKGIRIRRMGWVNSGWSNFHKLSWGYDDYTVGCFEAETGIRIQTANSDSRRFGERYRVLIGKYRKEWLAWRSKKVTELYIEAKNIIQKIRPDLMLYCNLDHHPERDYEGGIDMDALIKNGIPVSLRTFTGRLPSVNGGNREWRNDSLKTFEYSFKTKNVERPIMNWLCYYECGQDIAAQEELGLRKDKKHWYGSAAWPAGRNELEFWAVGMARCDTSLFISGIIGYGIGNPVMREFMNDYLRLPSADFTTVTAEPVAVRKYQKYFYAVNPLSVPVRISISLIGNGKAKRITDGSVFDVSDFELQPFQLMAFISDSDISQVRTTVPKDYVRTVAAQVAQVVKGVQFSAEVFPLAEKMQKALAAKQYYTVRMLLETNQAFLKENGISIPTLYDTGMIDVPAGAVTKCENPVKKLSAKTLFPLWSDGEFSTGKSLKYQLQVNHDGMFRLNIAHLGGDAFGTSEIFVDGQKYAILENAGGECYTDVNSPKKALFLTVGIHDLELRTQNQKEIGVLYVKLESMRTRLTSRLFVVSENRKMPAHMKMEEFINHSEDLENVVDRTSATWSPASSSSDEFFIVSGPTGAGNTAYVATTIRSEKACTVELSIGVDYFFKIILNGKVISRYHYLKKGGAAAPDQHQFLLPLRAGDNQLVFKISSGTDSAGLWCSISDPGGLTFFPDGKNEKTNKIYEVSNLLWKVNFRKKSTEELKQLLKEAEPVNRSQMAFLTEYNRKVLPEKIWNSLNEACRDYEKKISIQLKLMKKNPKTEKAARLFESETGGIMKAEVFLEGCGYVCRLINGRKNLSMFQNQWTQAGLMKNEEFLAAERKAYECITRANKMYDQFRLTNREARVLRNLIIQFYGDLGQLHAELRKRQNRQSGQRVF